VLVKNNWLTTNYIKTRELKYYDEGVKRNVRRSRKEKKTPVPLKIILIELAIHKILYK
jgi:hypothetical protein